MCVNADFSGSRAEPQRGQGCHHPGQLSCVAKGEQDGVGGLHVHRPQLRGGRRLKLLQAQRQM